MRILVQKFGGTSVSTADNRQLAVGKISRAVDEGYQPVVVVSAMGRNGQPYATDTLIGVAREPFAALSRREMDLMMGCGEIISAVVMAATLQAAGLTAVVLTGGQAGIFTDPQYGNARILNIDPSRIRAELKAGKIPVVCGFQGVTENGDLTTLGRGGSDTTASALGAALAAEMIEIYTDVDGIMTADPRLVPHAHILDRISYAEVSQLAHQGAKVIHPRAVEFAMQKNIPLVVKSTFSDAPGTLITAAVESDQTCDSSVSDRVATGVTYVRKIAQIIVTREAAAKIAEDSRLFKTLAQSGINVDLINVLPGQVLFTVQEEETEETRRCLSAAGYFCTVVPNCAKVSVVGGGMGDVPGVMASFVEALTEQGIPLLQTVDSQTSISALIDGQFLETAVSALHSQFGLD
ncbi:MAG: aspartate kinase [Veillonellaceae bacterium]|nr:aspartate kinase [Veillonellaceae bacterium]